MSLILYYASARFRLPLVPMLAILGGGVFASWAQIRLNRGNQMVALGMAILVGVTTYSSFGGIRNRDTYVQDRLLLANANAEIGRDSEAARYASIVLQDHPDRSEAQRVYSVSYFNMRLIQSGEAGAFGTWDEQKSRVTQTPPTDPVQDAVLGVYFMKWGQRERAIETWSAVASGQNAGAPLARACLAAIGIDTELPRELEPLKAAASVLFEQND